MAWVRTFGGAGEYGAVVNLERGSNGEFAGFDILTMGVLFLVVSVAALINHRKTAAFAQSVVPPRSEPTVPTLVVVGLALFAVVSLGLMVLGVVVDAPWASGA